MTKAKAYPIAKIDIRTIEKAMWMARILNVMGSRHMAAYELHDLLVKQCVDRNLKCIYAGTTERYLKELVKNGTLNAGKRRMREKVYRWYYWKKVEAVV